MFLTLTRMGVDLLELIGVGVRHTQLQRVPFAQFRGDPGKSRPQAWTVAGIAQVQLGPLVVIEGLAEDLLTTS